MPERSDRSQPDALRRASERDKAEPRHGTDMEAGCPLRAQKPVAATRRREFALSKSAWLSGLRPDRAPQKAEISWTFVMLRCNYRLANARVVGGRRALTEAGSHLKGHFVRVNAMCLPIWPAKWDANRSWSTRSRPVRSEPVRSEPVRSEPVRSDSVGNLLHAL